MWVCPVCPRVQQMDPCFDQSFGHGYWSISPTDCHLFAQDSPELGRRWADAGHPARWMKNESAVTTSQQSTLPASPFHQRSILAGTNKQTSNHIGLSKDWRLRTSCYGEGLGLCHASPPALSRSRLRSAFCRSIPASRPTCGFSEPSMQKFQFAPESRAKSQGSASEKEANQKCS